MDNQTGRLKQNNKGLEGMKKQDDKKQLAWLAQRVRDKAVELNDAIEQANLVGLRVRLDANETVKVREIYKTQRY